jgi:hypothetical protein
MEPPNETYRVPPGGWVISEGKLTRMDPTEFDPEADPGTVKAYRLSEIGRYLMNPGPIEVRKRLVGCEVHRTPNRLSFLRRASRRPPKAEIILSGVKLKLPALKDPDLEAHLKRMIDELRVFDSFGNKLALLDTRKVSHLVGICEDGGGGHSYLKLQGSADDKIRYLNSHVGRDVRVTIHRAHMSEGLFELRGFPAAGFSPANTWTLYLYSRDGQPAACVLTALGNLDFRLPDPQAINYLSLLENTLNFSPGFRKAFDACFMGGSRPLRLAFNRQPEVDYSKASFPEVYRDVFRTAQAAAANCNLVKPVLNYLQTTVALSYLPAGTNGDERPFTHMCILHDLRAIEPLRKSLPAVYAEMNRRAFSTETGRFYILDSITGAARAD